MAIFNQVYTYTITNGGGTLNLDVTDSTTTRYVFSGTATLAANWVIQPTGSPTQGTEFIMKWQSACTIGANSVTIFGTALTADQALNDLIITCYYNGSAWDVDIQQDGVQEIWEIGTGTNSAKLVNGGTSTASGTNAVNAGLNNTASGNQSFTAGSGNTATSTGSISIGTNNTSTAANTTAIGSNSDATGQQALALGEGAIASGDDSVAIQGNTASANSAFATGQETEATADYSFSGGFRCFANRYGQFTRSSGKSSSGQAATGYSQVSWLDYGNYTTNATPVLLYLDKDAGVQLITIPTNSSILFEGAINAVQLGGGAGTAGDSATWIFNGHIKNVSGTTALVDSVLYLAAAGTWGASAQRTQDAAAAAWTIAITADNGTDSLSITATGEANKNIYWEGSLKLTEIKYNT